VQLTQHVGTTTHQCFHGQTISPYADSSNSVVCCTSIQMQQKLKVKTIFIKKRPLLNILKKTLGVFLSPGLEMSLDEASCASRSSYGRELNFLTRQNTVANYTFDFTFYVMHQHYFVSHSSPQQVMTVNQRTQRKRS
jgi:hypothetical protein